MRRPLEVWSVSNKSFVGTQVFAVIYLFVAYFSPKYHFDFVVTVFYSSLTDKSLV